MFCKQCQKEFEISPVGLDILKTVNIPSPQICDVCAMRTLMSFRNERTFYPRKCDKCSKNLIAMYPADSPFTVYCSECWWGDSWDGTNFGFDYEGAENFFEKLKEIQQKVPREGLVNLKSPNCDYSNHIRDSRGCYMSSLVADNCEECYYCYWIVQVKDSADCYYGIDNQKCYFCVSTIKSYDCSYLLDSENCMDCHYCFDIRGCKNCMFSSNLRNQQYVFENEQLTKEEYEKKIVEINRGSWNASRKYKERWNEIIKKSIHRYSNQTNCQNCSGDNIQNSINTELAWNSFGSENVYNASSSMNGKNLFNCFSPGTQPVEGGANIAVIRGGTNVIGCFYTVFSSDVYFCENLVSCMDCIGCTGLHKKKFCILNKEYSEAEYKKIKQELLDYWSDSGALSEFLPKNISAFAYNETAAQDFYPLTKEEAEKNGYSWRDDMPGTFNQETIKADDLPDDIEDMNNGILGQTLGCVNCGRNYKVIEQELKIYKALGVPVPRECFGCRFRQRIDLMGDRDLIERQCDYIGCSNKFMTKYKPEDKKIYYDECYKKEIY